MNPFFIHKLSRKLTGDEAEHKACPSPNDNSLVRLLCVPLHWSRVELVVVTLIEASGSLITCMVSGDAALLGHL